ncbi:interferon lambda receptor 1-like [Colius striatus]|uniref:interferon lambda receptor 1-like n=1 Tax=Colius striatus TaxID=57412 RepID=UPI002B1E38B6|nr:interferon lambda receptor 1-like [Colius striatus]
MESLHLELLTALEELFNCSSPVLSTPLLPPRDVRLEAQNFHVLLQWAPAPGSPSDATYQAEWKRRSSRWTKADACWGNSTSSSWACKLYFGRIHDLYWARVRAVAGAELSEWAYSSELQPYRDTIVGPPELSLQLQGHTLNVSIHTPPTPFRSRAGSYRPVERVLRKLRYWLNLYEGDVLVQRVPCRWRAAACTFRYLKGSTRYCVQTAAQGMGSQRSREAKQCMWTPAAPAGFPWVLLAVLSGIFLLLSVAGLYFIQLHVLPSPSEMHLPETLQALLNKELSVTFKVPLLELEEDSFTLFPPIKLLSHGAPAAEPAAPTVRLLRGQSPSQDPSGYCANGFGPVCHEGKDSSCSHSQLGHALGSQLSLQPEEDEEAWDGDEVLEQLVPVGLTRDGCTCDKDYRTSEMWHPLHLQLYSQCQCPALGVGSCHPLPAEGRSLSQEDLPQSLGTAGHWVPLSSVKLQTSEEEDGGWLVPALQHGCGSEPQPGDSPMLQGDLEQAASGIPLPCQQPPLSPSTLQAFSGYELRPTVGNEP